VLVREHGLLEMGCVGDRDVRHGHPTHGGAQCRKRLLERGFALLVVATGSYVIARAAG
jgi:hypothetical protein